MELASSLVPDLWFAVTSLVAVGAALLSVTRKNPVYSAVWMLVCFLAFAVVLWNLSAPFLAAIHVLVYTGAILVLFVFVIMLLNLKDEELGEEYGPRVWAGGAALSVSTFAVLAIPIVREPKLWLPLADAPKDFGSVESVGNALFRENALPFELVSLLIIVAMFGAMVLAKKRLWT